MDEQKPLDPFVFLNGRPPMGEVLGFAAQAVYDAEPDLGPVADAWRLANDRVRELEVEEAGFADNPAIKPLPKSLANEAQLVQRDPIFVRSFSLVPVQIALVELDRLVVFQKSINLRYVKELQDSIDPRPSPTQIFRMCLPYDHPVPPVRMSRTGPGTFTFQSDSNDFRFLDSVVLSPDKIVGYQVQGVASHFVVLPVGHGSNYLNAIHAQGRLVLNNGSHRAYALRDLGITHVPCLIQEVTRVEELSVVALGPLSDEADRYLVAPRPPVLKDYFDDRLRMLVSAPRTARQVAVAFGSERIDVPA